jgi:CheY-like chemotaxis protein
MPHKIFIADDNQDFVLLFSNALNQIVPDSQCMSAENGYQALSSLQFMLPSVPDFIFIDVKMPIMDGYQIVREIKKIGAFETVPVILLSSEAIPLKVNGVQQVFLKPFNSEELNHMLNQVLKTTELK